MRVRAPAAPVTAGGWPSIALSAPIVVGAKLGATEHVDVVVGFPRVVDGLEIDEGGAGVGLLRQKLDDLHRPVPARKGTATNANRIGTASAAAAHSQQGQWPCAAPQGRCTTSTPPALASAWVTGKGSSWVCATTARVSPALRAWGGVP